MKSPSHIVRLGQEIPEGISQKARLAYLHHQNKISNEVNNSEGQGRVPDAQSARMYQHQQKLLRSGENMGFVNQQKQGHLQNPSMNQEHSNPVSQGANRANMMYKPASMNTYQMNNRGK